MQRPTAVEGGRRIDLHAHTTFSDGTMSPESLVRHAMAKKLAALAITDHDSVDALDPARRAADATLEVVPGIEISTCSATTISSTPGPNGEPRSSRSGLITDCKLMNGSITATAR